MHKFIDADKAKNGIMKFVNKYGEIVGMFVNDFNILLERCAADVVEVVRCKECKYAHMTMDGECKYCDIWFPDEKEYIDGDYFCASGERKNGQ